MNDETRRVKDLATATDDKNIPVQEEFWQVSELIRLERDRIQSFDRRTDVAFKAIDANDASDERQFEFHMEKLRRDDKDRQMRHSSGLKLVWASMSFTVFTLVFLILMAFFGSPDQQTTAERILIVLGTGVGGAGIFFMLTQILRRLSSKSG